jgi:HEAT repeats
MSFAARRFWRPVFFVGMALLTCSESPSLVSSHDGTTEHAEKTRGVLRNGVESKDPDERIQAIVAVSMIGRNEVVIKGLEGLLENKNVEVRIAAIRALVDLKARQSASALEKILKKR